MPTSSQSVCKKRRDGPSAKPTRHQPAMDTYRHGPQPPKLNRPATSVHPSALALPQQQRPKLAGDIQAKQTIHLSLTQTVIMIPMPRSATTDRIHDNRTSSLHLSSNISSPSA